MWQYPRSLTWVGIAHRSSKFGRQGPDHRRRPFAAQHPPWVQAQASSNLCSITAPTYHLDERGCVGKWPEAPAQETVGLHSYDGRISGTKHATVCRGPALKKSASPVHIYPARPHLHLSVGLVCNTCCSPHSFPLSQQISLFWTPWAWLFCISSLVLNDLETMSTSSGSSTQRATGPYLLGIEGVSKPMRRLRPLTDRPQLPRRYTWQDLKDLIRKQAAHNCWTEMAVLSNGQSDGKGAARVPKADEATKLFSEPRFEHLFLLLLS